MEITLNQTIGEIVTVYPETARVFESNEIDYCCGGKRSLQSVCDARNVRPAELLQELRDAVDRSAPRSEAWTDARLAELMQHILSEHHALCRVESARLLALLRKVVARHGAEHPELEDVQRLFWALSKELSTHMLKEEQVLFPLIERLEQAKDRNQPLPSAFFSSVNNPIRDMLADHDEAGALSARIRELTGNYAVPEAACNSYRALLHGLAEFERDLHVHVHLENNVLFPRACELETAA